MAGFSESFAHHVSSRHMNTMDNKSQFFDWISMEMVMGWSIQAVQDGKWIETDKDNKSVYSKCLYEEIGRLRHSRIITDVISVVTNYQEFIITAYPDHQRKFHY